MFDSEVPSDVPVSRDILWCFKPTFIWMRVLGIELEPRLRNKVITAYGFLIFLVTVFANIKSAAASWETLTNLTPSNETGTTITATWNMRIDCANQCFLVLTVCPAFFYIIHSNQLTRLWRILTKFELTYCKLNHGQLRKRFFIGIAPLLAEISITTYYLVKFSAVFGKDNFTLIISIITCLSKLLPISILVFYCCISWIISLFYSTIQDDVYGTKTVKQEDVLKWKRSLSLVSELVDKMNECFGLILLVLITHFFIDFVIQSFYLGNGPWISSWVDLSVVVAYTMTKFCALWFMAYTPSQMRSNAIKTATSLRKIFYLEPDLQNQVSLLTLDMYHCLPKVSALGYFEVNLQLVPKLLGTTLTYFIIVYQFHTSEKEK